jgi:hypothetical protein
MDFRTEEMETGIKKVSRKRNSAQLTELIEKRSHTEGV